MGTYFALKKFMRLEKIAIFTIVMLVLVTNVAAQSAGTSPLTQGPIPSQPSQLNETNELNEIRTEAGRVARAAVLAQQDAILKTLKKAQAEVYMTRLTKTSSCCIIHVKKWLIFRLVK